MSQEAFVAEFKAMLQHDKTILYNKTYKYNPKLISGFRDLLIDAEVMQSGTIANEVKEYIVKSRWNSKNGKYIDVYQNDRFAPISSKKWRRDKTHHILEMLLIRFKLTDSVAVLVASAMSYITEWLGDTDDKYAPDTAGSYSRLDEATQEKFFEEFQYRGSKNEKKIGYKFRDEKEMSYQMEIYLIELERVGCTDGLGKKPDNYLQIKLDDFVNMTMYSKIVIFRNLEYVKDFILHVNMMTKQEIGNNGRQYNTMNEIDRISRGKMTNLWGIDMATAAQTILLKLVKDIDPDIKLPFTETLIADKRSVRKEVKELMNFEDINKSKTFITSIYQGLPFHDKYEPVKHIFDERDKIAKLIMTMCRLKTQQVKYAKYRVDKKLDEADIKYSIAEYIDLEIYIDEAISKKDFKAVKDFKYIQNEIEKKLMFFIWTFDERKIQDIISREFKYPKTLHDAVYTQNKEEFDRLDIYKIRKTVLEELGIDIVLDVA